MRIITFSKPDEHSELPFKKLEILKLTDLVTLYKYALFMYQYHNYNIFPSLFENFFQTVSSLHSYNTRLATKSTYYINTIKTNYGKFNIHFAGVKVWNNLDESIKHLPFKTFKSKLKSKKTSSSLIVNAHEFSAGTYLFISILLIVFYLLTFFFYFLL